MKNKKGKKLVVLGAMAALLTLIGVSGSQTYAKYVETTNVKSTSATVAKWGFVMTANLDKFLAADHNTLSGTETSVVASGTGISAKSTSTIVAPGTFGHADFTLTGNASEVKSEISLEMYDCEDIYVKFTDDTYYYPLKWSYEGVATLQEKDLETLASGMNTVTKTFAPGDTASGSWKVHYSWPFTVSGSKTVNVGGVNHTYSFDQLDTLLGNVANNAAYPLPEGVAEVNTTLVVNFRYTATQVQ